MIDLRTSLCFKSALAMIASATDIDQQMRLTKAISIDLPPGFLSTCCPSVVFIYEIFQGPEDARFGWLLRTLKIWLAADVFPAVPYGEVCDAPLRFLAVALGIMTDERPQERPITLHTS